LKPGLKLIADQRAQDPPDLGHLSPSEHERAGSAPGDRSLYLSRQFGIKNYIEMDIGITVGTHVGPGAAGIAISQRNRGMNQ
jgi:hypothetical protein